MKSIAGDQKLHELTAAQVRPDHGALGRAIHMQHQYFNRITEIVMIKLVVTDAMEPHRSIGSYHEIKR